MDIGNGEDDADVRADQRADTPRTAAGQRWWKALGGLPDDGAYIAAIEAEAAAEPAAAEPLREVLERLEQAVYLLVNGGSPEVWPALLKAQKQAAAALAQPPRGSLSDRPTKIAVQWGPTPEHLHYLSHVTDWGPNDQFYQDGCSATISVSPEPEGSTVRVIVRHIGGSLTATEPPLYCDHGRPIGPPCSECAAGSPRGVTPALDVERLRRAMTTAGLGVPYNDADPIETEHAKAVAAEYARLGSPEDSEPSASDQEAEA